MLKNFVLAIMLLCSMPAHAFDDYVSKISCDENQISLNQCAADEFNYYDRLLNKFYSEQINYLLHDKQNIQYKKDSGLNLTEAGDRLKASQKAWMAFRDADCLYQAGLAKDSGSIWPLEYYGCMTKHTKIRAKQLEEYVKCRYDGCQI